MKQAIRASVFCLIGAVITSAIAPAKADAPNIRKAENCANVGWIADKLQKFADLKPGKTDTVGVTPAAHLKLEDGSQHYPDRYFIKDLGVETELPIGPGGQLIGFENLRSGSDTVELCHSDPKRAGLPFDADGISLDINTDVHFHNQSGTHSLTEIKDGLKDGRAHYKKTAGAMSMFVPRMSHVMVKYADETQPLDFSAMKGGGELTAPVPVVYCMLPMIKVKDLEAIGADTLKISGGPYRLLPVPNLDAMKRFEGCGDDT